MKRRFQEDGSSKKRVKNNPNMKRHNPTPYPASVKRAKPVRTGKRGSEELVYPGKRVRRSSPREETLGELFLTARQRREEQKKYETALKEFQREVDRVHYERNPVPVSFMNYVLAQEREAGQTARMRRKPAVDIVPPPRSPPLRQVNLELRRLHMESRARHLSPRDEIMLLTAMLEDMNM